MENTLTITAETRQKTSTNLVLLFIICFAGNMFGGVISALMSGYLPVVVKELQGNKSADQLNVISGFINSMFIFGWAAGGFLWGFVGDWTGRKKSLLLSIAGYALFTILTGLMHNWWGIVLCRFMSGFGMGGLLVLSFTLISEVWPEKSRAVFTGILSISIPVGIFSAGAINRFVTEWRPAFIVGIIPLVIAIAGFWLISESELWLDVHSKKSNLEKPTNHLLHAGNIRALLVGSLIFGTMLIGLWAIFSWLPTWIQSLSATNSQKEGGLSIMFLGMGGLIGGGLSGWVMNLIGLRRSLIMSFAVCSVLSFVLFKTNSSFSPIIYAEIAVLALFFGASQGILSMYIPLLFPTAIRASATGFCFNVFRIFTGIAVLTVGVMVKALGGYGNALFIFSLVFVVGLIAMLLIKNIQPDTHNQNN